MISLSKRQGWVWVALGCANIILGITTEGLFNFVFGIPFLVIGLHTIRAHKKTEKKTNESDKKK